MTEDEIEDEVGETRKQCRTCRWWWQSKPWHAAAPCHRSSPQRMATNQRASWPITLATDGCGDHSEERHG